MSAWSKDLRTVLGIVLVGFSAATIATVLEKTPSAVRQALPSDFSQKLPLSVQATISGHTTDLGVGRIHFKQALRLMERLTLADEQSQVIFFKHPQSVQFSVKRELSFNLYRFKVTQ